MAGPGHIGALAQCTRYRYTIGERIQRGCRRGPVAGAGLYASHPHGGHGRAWVDGQGITERPGGGVTLTPLQQDLA